GDRGVARLETPRVRRRPLGARRVPRPARPQRRLVLALLRQPPHRPRPAGDPGALERHRDHHAALLASPWPRRVAARPLPALGDGRARPELRVLAPQRSVTGNRQRRLAAPTARAGHTAPHPRPGLPTGAEPA